jgi:hypothetical protein
VKSPVPVSQENVAIRLCGAPIRRFRLVYGIFVLATKRHKHLKKKRPLPQGSGPSLGRKRQSHLRGRIQTSSRFVEWWTSFKGSTKKSHEQGQKSSYQTDIART